MPDTRPGLKFDSNGICYACIHYEKQKTTDWNKRWKELERLCDKYRGKNGNGYDCAIAVSGGKDSHFQTYIIKEKHGKHGWHYDTGVHYIVDNEAVPVLATGHMTWCDFGCSILLTDNETAGYLEYRDGTKLLPKKHYCGLAIHSSDVEHRVVDASSKRHTLLFFLQRKL